MCMCVYYVGVLCLEIVRRCMSSFALSKMMRLHACTVYTFGLFQKQLCQ